MRLSELRFIRVGFAVSGLLFGPLSWAGIVVNPVPPYVYDTSTVPPTVAIAGDANPLATGPQPGRAAGVSGMDTGFTFFKLSDGFTPTGSSPSPNNMVLFDVSVTGTPTVGNSFIIVASAGTAVPAAGTFPSVFIPIAAAGATGTIPPFCTVNNSCQFTVGASGVTVFQGAIVPGSPASTTVRVGIYLKDLCASNAASQVGTFCNGSGAVTNPNSATLPTPIQASNPSPIITFYAVSNVPASPGSPGTPVVDATALVSSSFQLQVVAAPLDIAGVGGVNQGDNCSPLSPAPYFPGDGQINLNASTMNPLTNAGSRNFASSLIVVGVLDPQVAVPSAATFSTQGFAINVHATVQGSNTITGFQNSPPLPAAQFQYQLYFSYVDAAGIVGPFSCSTTDEVKTAAIFGFLKKNGCFVATGAFHGEPASGVRLLQRFRDQVLNRSTAGRELRDWYYGWSPSAGWWLLENPEYRFPVLRFLLPFEAMAWILLHPLLATLLGGLGVLVIAGAVVARGRKGEGMA